MPEEYENLRPCPACGSEDRKTTKLQGARAEFLMFFDMAKMAICKKCGNVYEYKDDEPTDKSEGGVSITMG